jgi:hypothetical protein
VFAKRLDSHAGQEVLGEAQRRGLRVVDRWLPEPGGAALIEALSDLDGCDVVNLRSQVDAAARGSLYLSSDVVMALGL